MVIKTLTPLSGQLEPQFWSSPIVGAPLSVRNTMMVLFRIPLSERADTICPTESSNFDVISVINIHQYKNVFGSTNDMFNLFTDSTTGINSTVPPQCRTVQKLIDNAIKSPAFNATPI